MTKTKFQYIIAEQIHQMEKHRWIEGVKRNCDPGDAAFHEWVDRYAALFRVWAETVPFECIDCRRDCDNGENCCRPFDEDRIQFWVSSQRKEESSAL